MAFPITAILRFQTPGVTSGLKRIESGFKSLSKSIKSTGRNLDNIGKGFKSVALASVPVVAGVGTSTKAFADFEAQMSTVKALTRGVTDDEFKDLGFVAKSLGTDMGFSAFEGAEGLQFLAKAGIDAKTQIEALSTVMTLSVASQLDLGRTSDILTDSYGALKISMDETAGVAKNMTVLGDMFAFVQADTNTDLAQLAENIKFGGSTLANFGLQLPDIIAAMGALASNALKGSLGGTALGNMYNKLVKGGPKINAFMEDNNISLTNMDNTMRRIPDTVADVIAGLEAIENPAKRSAMTMILMGQRGNRAFNALKSLGELNLKALADGIANSTSESARIAKIRLDNLAGVYKKFKVGLNLIMLEIGNLVDGIIRKPLVDVANTLRIVGLSFGIVSGNVELTKEQASLFMTEFGPEKTEKILNFVDGVREGFKDVKKMITDAVTTVKQMSGGFDDAGISMNEVGKATVKMLATLAIAGPIIAAIGISLLIINPIVIAITSSFGLLWGVLNIASGGIVILIEGIVVLLGVLLSPIGLVALAIVGIGFLIFKFKDDIIKGLTIAYDFIADGFNKTFEFLSSEIKVFGKWLLSFLPDNFISAISDAIKAFRPFMTIIDVVKNAISGIGTIFSNIFKIPALKSIFGFFGNVAGVLKNPHGFKIDNIQSSEVPAISKITGGLKSGLGDLSPFGGIGLTKVSETKFFKTVENIKNIVKLQETSITRKAISMPDSSRISKKSTGSSQQEKNITTNVNVILNNKVLATAVATQAIQNAGRSGKSINPHEQRRMIENGGF